MDGKLIGEITEELKEFEETMNNFSYDTLIEQIKSMESTIDMHLYHVSPEEFMEYKEKWNDLSTLMKTLPDFRIHIV